MKFFLLMFLLLIQNTYGVTTFQKKFPHGMLTDDYGILTEHDLAKDLKGVKVTPYNENEFEPAYYRWQCFPTSSIKPIHRKWQGEDPMGGVGVKVTLCDFEIVGKLGEMTHEYGLRRAKLLEFCVEFQNAWDKATNGEKYICVQGASMALEKKDINGKIQQIKSWIWNKFKTKKGCHSFFQYEDDCK